ncbi:MAG: hypothetical protein HZB56_21950 [Deltaproteobacteria bacterium]|nr:hypothetical protein [Deltaproteobacteria bacterium]
MTEHAHSGHPPAEVDRIQSWTVVAVGVASLLLFFVAAAITVTYMRREELVLNPAHPMLPSEAGKRKIGIVEQQLFENADRARTLQAQKQAQLGSYGWIDRQKGLVHVPVDQAVDRLLQGERP